ncbi:MAG: rhodanese-like domain-containing protein, partial [Rhodoferax sp.]|uniref:rhodanese-like domain-containing protein n=1 Tax=Rhodoferax sp. TaxID=50421 RepID=UPI001B527D4B
ATLVMLPMFCSTVVYAQAAAEPAAPAASATFKRYSHIVDLAFVKPYAVAGKSDAAMIIDARPAARKFNLGHIPTAVNLPDSQFDKLAPKLLPADKSKLLIFYCDGPTCVLSHNSAFRAEKLGYTNIRVYEEGMPDWVKNSGLPAALPPPMMEAGKDAGTITVASFERIYKEAPGTVHLIDVREPQEVAAGTFKGAVNFPINTLEKSIDKLPTDKPIIFFCGAGGRSGEAYDMVKLYKPELKTAFLDADIKWAADGSYTIKAK